MVFGLGMLRLTEMRSKYVVSDSTIKPFLASSDKIEKPIRENFVEASLKSLEIKAVYICDSLAVPQALAHLLSQSNLLGLDIETYGLPDFASDKQAGLEPRKSGIRLVQFFDGNKTVYVFDIMKIGGLQVLGNDIWKKPMVAHNAMFELKHLIHKGAYPKQIGCTLLMDRVINGNRMELREDLGLSKSAALKDLAKELLNLVVSKEQQTSDWSTLDLSQEQIEYAALDAVLVSKLFSIQRSILSKCGLVRAYQVLRDAQHPVSLMELSGIGFNVDKHKQLIEQWNLECETLRRDILKTLGCELNLNSGKQLNEWLNEALEQKDLEIWAKTPKGQLSTSTPTFKIHEHMHDIFPKLVEYRHVAKRISSFGDSLYKFIDISSKRLYGSFSLGTTTTGRMASNKPNMQNMPRTGFRDLFCAQEGFVLVGLDYSQQELRVAALVTGDKELLHIYEQGGDVHTRTASAILKIPKEQIGKEQRQLAKAVIFGLLYGQGAKGLAVYAKRQYSVDMTEGEAEKHRSQLFKTYKGLREWQKRIGNITQITSRIRTPCGRIRDFSREKIGYRYTAALNLPIQGAAAEITLYALSRLTHLICSDCRLVNVIHDEILLEVREDRAQEFEDKARYAMEQAFLDVFPGSEIYLKGLIESKIGKNWAETK